MRVLRVGTHMFQYCLLSYAFASYLLNMLFLVASIVIQMLLLQPLFTIYANALQIAQNVWKGSVYV